MAQVQLRAYSKLLGYAFITYSSNIVPAGPRYDAKGDKDDFLAYRTVTQAELERAARTLPRK